jgi:hypothetical protein
VALAFRLRLYLLIPNFASQSATQYGVRLETSEKQGAAHWTLTIERRLLLHLRPSQTRREGILAVSGRWELSYRAALHNPLLPVC